MCICSGLVAPPLVGVKNWETGNTSVIFSAIYVQINADVWCACGILTVGNTGGRLRLLMNYFITRKWWHNAGSNRMPKTISWSYVNSLEFWITMTFYHTLPSSHQNIIFKLSTLAPTVDSSVAISSCLPGKVLHETIQTRHTGQESVMRTCDLNWQLRYLLRWSRTSEMIGSTILADSSSSTVRIQSEIPGVIIKLAFI